MHYCKICNKETIIRRSKCGACNTAIRRIRNKMAAIEFLGGNCCSCNLRATSKNLPLFEFHHRNPNEKDFNIGVVGNKSWDSIKDEISKCNLLCANCHHLEHFSLNREKLLQEASNYAGSNPELDTLVHNFLKIRVS